MYRETAWEEVRNVLLYKMNWGWMALSLMFGILPQMLRGWRWHQTLTPLDEYPRKQVCVYSIFVSYASSLLIPRVGEITRCATLARYEGTSFSKAVGTVVTERIVDSLFMLVVTGITLLAQMGVFLHFFQTTGTSFDSFFSRFSATGYFVTSVCLIAAVVLGGVLVWRLSMFQRIKGVVLDLWTGISSLRRVRNLPLYLFYSVAIWACYYMHLYLTFFCFDFTNALGPVDALVVFCVGSYAVLVPTPNGAGPWHFAVKTMLVLYGVAANDAIVFALVVHTLQTALIIVLGTYGATALSLLKVRKNTPAFTYKPNKS